MGLVRPGSILFRFAQRSRGAVEVLSRAPRGHPPQHEKVKEGRTPLGLVVERLGCVKCFDSAQLDVFGSALFATAFVTWRSETVGGPRFVLGGF